ncbi:uncharacterized protein EAF01_006428 [Botrytis porri]|uniref:Uncharacterized protein n=1 Tax=Botrytis porri TaxID=87229 RepID=A0A4Z1KJD4_9HELO|nr:uncharacterized protein EAF01_006428 [Botrytis porri]KAF7903379.1 hypothetical protein EAF01_006428 [Botrytis porri]TGO85600.1 hypothetical protein BPOR_0381g00050 [Botrytis porri]
MSPSYITLPPALPSELLNWILNHDAYPTTILICKPRAAFISSLLADITSSTPPLPPSPMDIPSSPPNPATGIAQSQTPSHSLLIKTLHQISLSRHISVIYIPMISHLRAYLSVLSPETASKIGAPPDQKWDKVGRKREMVVVYGLIDLHRDTSEWSAQGLSRSLAGLVESGGRDKRIVVCLEESERKTERSESTEMDAGGDEDIGGQINDRSGLESDGDMGRDNRTWKGWDEHVPMLNGSVRRTGLEGEDSGWSGRTIEVGRIFARWFDFGNAEWSHHT